MAAKGRLTVKLTEEICVLLRRGHYIRSAAAYSGVPNGTFHRWKERGNEARALRETGKPVPRTELIYLHFVDAVELARDHGEAWLVEQTLQAAENPKKGQRWMAYITLLERSRPERWRRPSRLDGGTPDKPQPRLADRLDVAKMSDDDLDALRELIDRALPADPAD